MNISQTIQLLAAIFTIIGGIFKAFDWFGIKYPLKSTLQLKVPIPLYVVILFLLFLLALVFILTNVNRSNKQIDPKYITLTKLENDILKFLQDQKDGKAGKEVVIQTFLISNKDWNMIYDELSQVYKFIDDVPGAIQGYRMIRLNSRGMAYLRNKK